MRMTKKIIALVMAITMISTCGVSTAFSAVRVSGDSDTNPPATKYTIKVTPNENATVSILVNDAKASTAKKDDKVSVTVTPNEGYTVESVKATGATLAAGTGPYTFSMPANDVTINVTTKALAADEFSLTVTGAENAKYSITVDGKEVSAAKAGAEVLFEVEADVGYKVTKLDIQVKPLDESSSTRCKFIMPNRNVVINVTVEKFVQPSEITGDDVFYGNLDGVTAGGVAVAKIAWDDTIDEDKNKIIEAMDAKLKAAGLTTDPTVGSFGAIDLLLVDKNGKALTGTLNKPIDITIKVTVAGFKPSKDNMRILHNHKGNVEVIKPSKVVEGDTNVYAITFPMSKFSTVMPVAVQGKGNGGGGTGNSGNSWDDSSYSGGSYGGGSGSFESNFDGTKMRLTGGEFVLAKTVEDIAGTDKVYTVNYKGKDYTFNGKNIPKPPKNVIYYTAEEFMNLIQGKLVSVSGGEANPDTGANDFAGVAMALAMVSLAGIAACNVAKKK